MENDDSSSYSNELDSNKSNQFYYGQISQLLDDSKQQFLKFQEKYQKCMHLISKDNKISNRANQRSKELFLLSTDPENEENNKLFDTLESAQTEHKQLKKVYNYLFSLLGYKTESGEIPTFIQTSFVELQSHLSKESQNDKDIVNKKQRNVSSVLADIQKELNLDQKMNSPQLNSKFSFPLLSSSSLSSAHFSSSSAPQSPNQSKYNLHTEFLNIQKKVLSPPSPQRNSDTSQFNSKHIRFTSNVKTKANIESDGTYKKITNLKTPKPKKSQAKSMLNFNNSYDYQKTSPLPKKTKSALLVKASSISYALSRLNNISDLADQVGNCQKELQDLDDKIEKLKVQSKKVIQKRLEKKSHLTLVKNVQSYQLADYADKGVNCDQIPSIIQMKAMIEKNAGEASQQLISIQQLQYLQNYLIQLNLEFKVILLANDRKMSDFKTIIANLKAVDPLFYCETVKNLNLSSKLADIKDEKEQRLKAIETRISEMQNQNDQIAAKNNDLSFIIENLKKQRMKMMQIPKANAKKLCNSLHTDRLIVNENNRQITFVKIIQNHLEQKLIKLYDRHSVQSFERIKNDIISLKNKVDKLKIKFDHLRAVRENHSFVLTNENELKFLHNKIHDLISSIDVSKMRMGGLLSKVEKQMKLLNQQNIPLPTPPHSYIIHQENVMKKKEHS